MTRDTRSLNLLVIEDETILTMDLECMLEDFGHIIVAAASNFDTALSLIHGERHRIDGAIVDANLSGRSSYPIVEELREWDIPSAVISGYTRDELKEMGFTETTLEKPYKEDQIKRALSKF